MSNLSHSSNYSQKIALRREIIIDPFKALFIEYCPANATLIEKTKYIKDFCVILKDIEEATEQVLTRNHWLGITSGFSAAAAVAGSTAMIPLAGLLVSGAAVVAAITAIADAYLTKSKVDPISETLTRHRIALESQKNLHWAALWELVEIDLFCSAVSYSARGFLCEGKLVQRGTNKDSPFIRATDYIAESLGTTYDAVIDAIDTAIAGRQAPQLHQNQRITKTKLLPSVEEVVEQPQDVITANREEYAPTVIQTPVIQPTQLQVNSNQSRQFAKRSAYTLILDNPLECRAFFGFQRTGKSYLVAVASQELHRRGTGIYHINLGSYGNEEDPYWCHCVKSVRGDISMMNAYEASQIIDEAISVVDEFYQQEDAILIFDEWIYAGKKNNPHTKLLQPLVDLVASHIGMLTQTGLKRSKAVWTIAPEFVAGTLIDSAKAIKSCSLVYVTIAPNRAVTWVHPKTGKPNTIRFNTQLFDQVAYNYTIEMPAQRFNVDRICYIDSEWLEVGNLPPLNPTLRSKQISPALIEPKQEALPITSNPAEYSANEKDEAVDAMVNALTNCTSTTLWSFVQDELGVADAEEIKKIMLEIGQMIFDDNLSNLKQKFRLQSVWDIRYSYPGYSKNVEKTHRFTNNKCCCCIEKKSEQAHHTEYLGLNDKPGHNLFATCKPCHDKLCHSNANWIQGNAWTAHSTPEWKAKLVAGFEMLSTSKKDNQSNEETNG